MCCDHHPDSHFRPNTNSSSCRGWWLQKPPSSVSPRGCFLGAQIKRVRWHLSRHQAAALLGCRAARLRWPLNETHWQFLFIAMILGPGGLCRKIIIRKESQPPYLEGQGPLEKAGEEEMVHEISHCQEGRSPLALDSLVSGT